ncbi:MAG: hypothetical protein IJK19_04595 [Bacteroidales bacterium]|nr:hypothetical protein [Bacteroidales bacterium]
MKTGRTTSLTIDAKKVYSMSCATTEQFHYVENSLEKVRINLWPMCYF